MKTILTLLLLAASLRAAELPLGHADFLPSPQRPVGWRGDGSGVFPGATTPTKWQDQLGATPGPGILWKTLMPSWTCSSPIVVGDKVFTLAEPHTLLCLEARTGKLLWQRDKENSPVEAMPATEAAAARAAWEPELAFFRTTVENMGEYCYLQQQGKESLPAAEREKRLQELVDWCQKEFGTHPDKRDQAAHGPRDIWLMLSKHSEHGKRIEALHKKYGIHVEMWRLYIGHSFATPVSDGQHVYVSFGFNQAVCYDLAGNRVWIRFYPHTGTLRPMLGGWMGHTNSPLLVGDTLILLQGGVVRAVNKRTGAPIWEQSFSMLLKNGHCGTGGDPVGSPVILDLAGEKVLFTTHHRAYRVRDGTILTEDLPGSVGSPVVLGPDALAFEQNKGLFAQRYRLAGDKLVIEPLWNVPGSSGRDADTGATVGPVRWGDNILTTKRQAVFSARDGQALGKFGKASGAHCAHPVVGNGVAVVFTAPGKAQLVNLEGTPKSLGEGALLSDVRADWNKKLPFAQLRDRWLGPYDQQPAWTVLVGTPFLHGNRMYVRTYEYLYCIGAN